MASTTTPTTLIEYQPSVTTQEPLALTSNEAVPANTDEYGFQDSALDTSNIKTAEMLIPADPSDGKTQLEPDIASLAAPPNISQPINSVTANSIIPDNVSQSTQNTTSFPPTSPTVATDLRVKISMPIDSPYILYKDTSNKLLSPIFATSGFVFPIQPQISISHGAEYQSMNPVHSNFTFYSYTNSAMKPISLTGEFLIRTQTDARYVMAGIHFLRSLTKSFTGLDGTLAGAPPMVARLTGLGFSGFDNIPVVITDVNVQYPDSVDYITVVDVIGGQSVELYKMPINFTIVVSMNPVFSRAFVSNLFGVKKYANAECRLLGNITRVSAEIAGTNNTDTTPTMGINEEPPDIAPAPLDLTQKVPGGTDFNSLGTANINNPTAFNTPPIQQADNSVFNNTAPNLGQEIGVIPKGAGIASNDNQSAQG